MTSQAVRTPPLHAHSPAVSDFGAISASERSLRGVSVGRLPRSMGVAPSPARSASAQASAVPPLTSPPTPTAGQEEGWAAVGSGGRHVGAVGGGSLGGASSFELWHGLVEEELIAAELAQEWDDHTPIFNLIAPARRGVAPASSSSSPAALPARSPPRHALHHAATLGLNDRISRMPIPAPSPKAWPSPEAATGRGVPPLVPPPVLQRVDASWRSPHDRSSSRWDPSRYVPAPKPLPWKP